MILQPRASLSFSILSVLLPSLSSATNCYWRNGNQTLEGYSPCSSGGDSMCCLIAGGATCTTLGLCNFTGTLSVAACTDPTWKSSACSTLCPSQSIGEGDVRECSNDSFCCATDETCCSKNQGLFPNGTTATGNHTSGTNTNGVFPPSDFHLVGEPNSWHFIIDNAWLATPIVAAIAWAQTWILGMLLAKHKGLDPKHVADSRYAGLYKRTTIASFLANDETAHPKEVIGYLAADPGISSQLLNLYNCKASFFNYAIWFVQLGSTIYAIFIACFVWSKDNTIKFQSAWLQFPLMLGVLNINRGTWAIAVTGCFIPGPRRRRRKALIATTVLALIIDALFISRAFIMAWHINRTAPVAPSKWTGILAWALPAVEGLIFFTGILFGYFNIEIMKFAWFVFWIPNFWLFAGPLFIIGVSLASHFNQAFLGIA